MAAGVALPLALVAAMAAASWLFAACYLAFARWARVQIDELKLGWGPKIFQRVVRGSNVIVPLVPIAASATVRGMNPFAEDVEPPEPPLLLWREAPLGRRLLGLVVAPRLVVAIVGIALLGPRAFEAAFVSGVVDFLAPFYGPLPFLDRAAATYRAEGFVALVGLVTAKMLVFHVLQIVCDALAALSSSPKGVAKLVVVLQLATFSVLLAWLVGYIRWML